MRLNPWIRGILLATASLLGSGLNPVTPVSPPAIVQEPRATVHGPAPAHLKTPLTLDAVAFATPLTIILAGTEYGTPKTVGVLESSDNDGRTWNRLATLSAMSFARLAFANARDGWASTQTTFGTNSLPKPNRVFDTENGGKTWTQARGQLPGVVTSILPTSAHGAWLGISGPCSKRGCRGSMVLTAPHARYQIWKAPGPILALARTAGTITAEVVHTSGRRTSEIGLYRFVVTSKRWVRVGTMDRSLSQEVPTAGQLAWSSPEDGIAQVYSLASCTMNGCGLSTVLQTRDGGARWTSVPSAEIPCQFEPTVAATTNRETVVEGVNQAACLGPSNTLFTASPHSSQFVDQMQWGHTAISAVGFESPRRMWALSPSGFLMSTDGGKAWTQQYPPPFPSAGVEQASATTAFGLGDQSDPGALLESVNGDKTWHVLSSLATEALVAVTPASATTLFAAVVPTTGEIPTAAQILISTNGGRSWRRSYQPRRGDTLYPTMKFFSANQGVLLNLPADCASVCPLVGAFTVNQGLSWHPLHLRALPSDMVAAALLSPTHWIVATNPVSRSGAVYDTIDGGLRWAKTVSLPGVLSGGAGTLSFPTPTVGYILVHLTTRAKNGSRMHTKAALLSTTNGGQNWVLTVLPSVIGNWPETISFSNAHTGILFSNGILWNTKDGGRIWSRVS